MKTFNFLRPCTEFETNHLIRLTCYDKRNTIEVKPGRSKQSPLAIGCTIIEEEVKRITEWGVKMGLLNKI